MGDLSEPTKDLSGLFDPSRVAVIGATERDGSVGRAVMTNLLADFEGTVVPVNPSRESVCGEPCASSIGEAGDVDLAVVVVPAGAAVEAVREAGEAGVENVVVITAGFGEAGSEGAARERELERVANEHGLNLVGPNCLGIISTPAGLNATFAPGNALPGSIAFASQSGAIVTAVLDWAAQQGIGFSDVVSLGNKTVLDETDFFETWGNDPDTDVIIGYLESIDDGRRFLDRVDEVTRETPVVLLKSGRTEAGAKAASSHTGAIAGSERAYEAGLAQAGVLRVGSLEELFDAARVLADQPLPDSDGVAVVTNAGGAGVLATDAIGDTRLSRATFEEETVEALEEALPAGANRYNPVDVIGDADAERFDRALEIVLDDPNVGAAAVLSAPTATVSYDALARVIADRRAEHDEPIVASLMGGDRVANAEAILGEAGVPNYFDPDRAVRSLETLADHRDVTTRERSTPTSFEVDRERAESIVSDARERGGATLGVEAMDLLEAYGIETPDSEIVSDPEAAVEAVDRIGGPVVMKIVSPDILHKTDIGGVKVGVERSDVADAYEDLVSRAYAYRSDATVEGVQIQELVDLEDDVETIVGVNRDPQFGPLVLFGLGGVFVEVFEDTAVRVAPVADRDAREMVEGIDAYPLLSGARGGEPVAIDAIVETIQRLSQLVTDHPEILELDVNPLVASPDGVIALDLRATLEAADAESDAAGTEATTEADATTGTETTVEGDARERDQETPQ
ncbi:acetate--CoA ligase family protein [Halopenitus salinus]|uniref:acetate--CoA ligase (ADP-forming) n=1 Tax=Halopenitus salinus TaxID=1198295 RepID=A0ABD5UUD2_9EURY